MRIEIELPDGTDPADLRVLGAEEERRVAAALEHTKTGDGMRHWLIASDCGIRAAALYAALARLDDGFAGDLQRLAAMTHRAPDDRLVQDVTALDEQGYIFVRRPEVTRSGELYFVIEVCDG